MHELDRDITDQLLSTTRSVRRRIDWERPVEPRILEECIELAVQAPTGAQAQSWRFLIVSDPAKKAALAELYRASFARFTALRDENPEAPTPSPAQSALAEQLERFPVHILVCAVGRPEPEAGRAVGFYGSVLPAAWSLMLALRARGLGTTWTSLLASQAEEVAPLLEIPEQVTQTVLLPVGYMKGAVLRPAERFPARQVSFWNRWGGAWPR